MEIRTRFWSQSKNFPKIGEVSGYSRAAFRTGFYVKNLDLLLDAGPQSFAHPTDIMITHMHGDHVAELPLTLIGQESGDHVFHIYAVKESEQFLRNYIRSFFELNLSQKIEDGKVESWYEFHPVSCGEKFMKKLNNNLFQVEIFNCDHSVPTVSYGFSTVKQKLKPEYNGISSRELGKMRQNGIDITQQVITPLLAFVCDTSYKVLELNLSLFDYELIFIECTFLYPEHRENAQASKHIHWDELEPYVKEHPHITFVLIHFSLQYKDDEIAAFFDKVNLNNVIVWN